MNQLNTEVTARVTPEPSDAPKPRDRRVLSAYRHGLTGQIILLTQADQVAYQNHCDGYFRSLAPVGDLETDLCQSCADDRWRMARGASLEAAIFAAQIAQPDEFTSGNQEVDTALAMGRAWIEKGGSIEKIALYESRLQRRYERNLVILQQLQEKRERDTETVLDQYEELARFAAANDEDYDGNTFPREALPDGFVFSIEKIEAVLTHRFNLRHARSVRHRRSEDAA